MGDFLHDLISAATTAAKSSPDAVAKLERNIRTEWGGARIYIAKSAPADRAESPRRVSTGGGGTSTPTR